MIPEGGTETAPSEGLESPSKRLSPSARSIVPLSLWASGSCRPQVVVHEDRIPPCGEQDNWQPTMSTCWLVTISKQGDISKVTIKLADRFILVPQPLSDQLFVCYAGPMAQQWLSHWNVDIIRLAYITRVQLPTLKCPVHTQDRDIQCLKHIIWQSSRIHRTTVTSVILVFHFRSFLEGQDPLWITYESYNGSKWITYGSYH